MKKVGIALIVLQVIGLIGALFVGRNPFSGGIFQIIGYFLCGIIGAILIIISYKKKPEETAQNTQIKSVEENPALHSNSESHIEAIQNNNYNNQKVDLAMNYKSEFKNYLIAQGYKEYTPSGLPSTVFQYLQSIEKVMNWENLTWIGITYNISSICSKYDTGGSKQYLGEQGHNTVINALRRYEEFIRTNS